MSIDRGSVAFNYDGTTGIVTVGVRPPLVLPKGAVASEMHVFDFLAVAATIQLKMLEDNKRLMQQGGARIA